MSCDNSLNGSESKRLAKRLKNEDPDQFQTLVRMHLSFVLDLNVDDPDGTTEKNKFRPLKWGLVPFSKKLKGSKGPSEGVPLNDDVVSQVHTLIKYLSSDENLKQEGIFRRSGKVTRQQELKNLLSKQTFVDLEEGTFSVHDCASVLKNFLAELPEPVLTEAHHPAYCQIAELYQSEKWSRCRMLRALQLLLLLLPNQNRKLLKDLIQLLYKTASLVENNRMSSENLATLFTPHFLCPRKLSPESLHSNSQNLSCIVVFMINEGQNIFDVPVALATDIKAYWDERRRTPDNMLEQSVNEVKTVFSFVDRERTAQENIVNPTETALAQLYAHIQGLPESSKKRRLIKQFNKENGHGTPRTKSISMSIKKHIFTKCQKGKDLDETGIINCDAILNSPMLNKFRGKSKVQEMMIIENGGGNIKKMDGEDFGCIGGMTTATTTTTPMMTPFRQGNNFQPETTTLPLVTSTPGGPPPHPLTPSPRLDHADMSPITRSTQRMPKAMQEAMVTPRSRKPVVALSGSNLCHLTTSAEQSWTSLEKEVSCSSESLTSPFKDYLFSRSVVTSSPVDLSFSSQAGDFDPWESGGDAGDPPSSPPAVKRLRSHVTETSL